MNRCYHERLAGARAAARSRWQRTFGQIVRALRGPPNGVWHASRVANVWQRTHDACAAAQQRRRRPPLPPIW